MNEGPYKCDLRVENTAGCGRLTGTINLVKFTFFH